MGLFIEWPLSGYRVAIKGLTSGHCEDIGQLVRGSLLSGYRVAMGWLFRGYCVSAVRILGGY